MFNKGTSMSIDEFIAWVKSLPFYNGWNVHYNYVMPDKGKPNHSFLATSGNKTHRYKRDTLEELVVGIKDTLAQIEKEAKDAAL